ncbi:MAG: amidase [Solirubrobacteraceae bacterium]|nr:amidase [Patulibacter sp.]
MRPVSDPPQTDAPAPSDQVSLTERSGLELAGMIRRGEVSSREVVEAHIARIAVTQPKVHGIVAYHYTDAREAADAADARIAAADPDDMLPPLLGVPCTIKESIGIAGMPNTAGFRPVADRLAERTAPAAQLLIDAGAIPLGVTNTSELCLWIESRNKVYGDSNNPYDTTRTVGGSSGGEGAVIGSGASPFGLGSDLAGSIRVPAFCCGVFGHKPSVGVVPTSGHFPVGEGPSRRMMVIGPIARRAEDLMPLMRILNWDDPDDPYDRVIDLGDPAEVCFDGLRVVIPHGFGASSYVSLELLEAREQAARHLESLGANVVRVNAKGLLKAQLVYIESLRAAWNDEFESSIGWEAQTVRDMYRGLASKDPDHTAAFVNLAAAVRIVGRLRRQMPVDSLDKVVDGMAAEMAEQIGDGIMLLPPLPQVAPHHGWTTLRPWSMQTMVLANLFGWPATQIPLGIGSEGLPLGVQVMAPMDQDHRTIAVALELEKAFGGWVPPEQSPTSPAPVVRHRGQRIRNVVARRHEAQDWASPSDRSTTERVLGLGVRVARSTMGVVLGARRSHRGG